MNNSKITNSINTYPYRAYLEALTSYGNDAKSTHLQSSLFYKDTAGLMDSIAIKDDEIKDIKDLLKPSKVNKGFLQRYSKSAKSAEFDGLMRLHLDLFHQSRLFLDNVTVEIKLTKA